MRVKSDESFEQIKLTLSNLFLGVVLKRYALKLGIRLLHGLKLQTVWPVVVMRRAEDAEYLEDLVDFTVSHEKRPLLQHLSKYAASTPHVNS